MKKHRFFIEQKIEDQPEITITDPNVLHQMKSVLRLHPSDPVILLDGTGNEYHGRIKILIKKESIISKEKIKFFSNKNKIKIKLFSSLIKKDKYEWVVQKGTELGVSQFIPIISERTEKLNLNVERMKIIAREAAEQSERVDLPQVFNPLSLKEALNQCETCNCIVFHDSSDVKFKVSQLEKLYGFCIFIGPEGGWGESDLKMFKDKGVPIHSLGKNILRAETAAIAALALISLN